MQLDRAVSPAMEFLGCLWAHKFEAARHSWVALNAGLSDALCLAIKLGLRFDAEDFAYLNTHLGFGYWCGADNAKNHGERFYTEAIEAGNLSACQAFEHYRHRTPFFVQGTRLHLGALVPWEGCQTLVTSFDDADHVVTLCAYTTVASFMRGGYARYRGEGKPLKRFTVTHAQLRAAFPSATTATATHGGGA